MGTDTTEPLEADIDSAVREGVLGETALGDVALGETALSEKLVWLYNTQPGPEGPAEMYKRVQASCRREVWERLVQHEGTFRVWISCLVRDLYLSNEALQAGYGIDDATDFWSWFDHTMWTKPQPQQLQRAR